jgi:Tfp pilus assembly protein PilE
MRIRLQQARRRAGVTLIEVLIAVGILMMVVAAIYSTWTSILKATRVGLDAAAAAQRERLTMEVLEQALAYTQMFSANARWYWFLAENGDSARLSFVSRLPKAFPRSGRYGDMDLRRVEFSLRPGEEGGKDLVLRQAPLLMEFDEDEREHPLVLARNVKELSFSFYDQQKNKWFDYWGDEQLNNPATTNKVPQLVLVKLVLGVSKQYSTSTTENTREVVRMIALHGKGVPPQAQRPGAAGPIPGQPVPPGQPGQPVSPLQPGQPAVPQPPGRPGVPIQPIPIPPGGLR